MRRECFPIVNLKIKVMTQAQNEVIVRMNEQLDFLRDNPGVEMPMSSSRYDEEQEYQRFESIMNTKLYLTKEEYDFCFAYDKDVREDTSYVGDVVELGDYLNLRLYSEHDHEKRQYEMEVNG